MKVTGWLMPDGKFLECNQWQHIEVIKSNPEIMKIVPRIGTIIADLDRIEEDCDDHAKREGSSNAEWHIYEMAFDNANHEIYRLLLNAGFIRVGEVNDELHFEGRPNHIKNMYQYCKDLADSYGASAVFEPQR